jgi:hypothetical protein
LSRAPCQQTARTKRARLRAPNERAQYCATIRIKNIMYTRSKSMANKHTYVANKPPLPHRARCLSFDSNPGTQPTRQAAGEARQQTGQDSKAGTQAGRQRAHQAGHTLEAAHPHPAKPKRTRGATGAVEYKMGLHSHSRPFFFIDNIRVICSFCRVLLK